MTDKRATRPILAIASGGGHWVQLMRIREALDEAFVGYASSRETKPRELGNAPYFRIPEANRDTPFRVLHAIMRILAILVKFRPAVVITTGAAPGAIAVIAGKMFGARTIWIDSIANVERMSMSGRMARPFADLYLTQWEHLERPEGPYCAGAVV